LPSLGVKKIKKKKKKEPKKQKGQWGRQKEEGERGRGRKGILLLGAIMTEKKETGKRLHDHLTVSTRK